MDQESILSSDAAFRAQFDPNSEHYHGGGGDLVALGGTRIPKGLEGSPDWQSLPIHEAKSDNKSFGSEYEKVEKIRNDLGELKKVMTVVTASVDTILTLKAANKAIDAEVSKRDKALADLAGYTKIFGEGSEFDKRAAIEEITKGSQQLDMSKEQQFDFGSTVKKHTSQIFREQKTLLERMKKLKKEATS